MSKKIKRNKIRIRILFIITQSKFGGAQRYLYELVTHLNPQKYQITVTAGPQEDNKYGLLARLEKYIKNNPELSKAGWKTTHLKYLKREINPYYDPRAFFEIQRLIKDEKPNTVFLCSTKAGILGSLANYKLQTTNYIKVIYRIGGWAFNDPVSWWKRKFYIWAEKFTSKYKDVIIVNSENNRKQAIKLGIKPRNRIVTIYNGIDINNLKFLPKEKTRKKLGITTKTDNTIIIGNIGNPHATAKGQIYWIDAEDRIQKTNSGPFRTPDTMCIIIGEGRERPKLEKRIKEYNLKNFNTTGEIPNAYKYLKAFDIFVLPSLKEGMPWAILEAMAAGLPIVATEVGGIPEMITKDCGILVPPANSEKLAKAINNLVKNKSLRLTLGQNAQKRVKEKFNLIKMIQETTKIL